MNITKEEFRELLLNFIITTPSFTVDSIGKANIIIDNYLNNPDTNIVFNEGIDFDAIIKNNNFDE